MALNELQRMHEDLERALRKPASKRSWAMVIDLRKCVGCHACTVSCAAENVCPPGTSYRKVFEVEYQSFPELDRFFMPANCQQCDNPPCMKAANKVAPGAIEKRKDGIVEFRYDRLRKNARAGEAAQKACPYYAIVEDRGGFYTEGTPVLEAYETRNFYEYDETLNRKKGDTRGAIRKCTFCPHRLDSGMLPACVSTCIGRAMYFGDKNDPKSLVSELIRNEKVWNLKAGLGTGPRIYYIGYEHRTTIAVGTPATCTVCHE
ncbi:MAG: 4Fe-4S dicluster domain-containing protein [Candidatus Methylomirabilales bacterium]